MEQLKKVVLSVFASLLIASFGVPAPAAAGCGQLCNDRFCVNEPGHPDWGCEKHGQFCLNFKCNPFDLDAAQVQLIADAAEAGDLELATKLASSNPSLQIFKDGVMLFNGPELAGIPGPEDSPAGTRVACAGSQEAAPATPAEAPAAAPATAPATTEQK